jgi:type IV pilus assembly protein PilM
MRWTPEVPLGLEIAPDALTLVRLRGRGRRRSLAAWRTQPLPPGLINVSPVEPNVTDPTAFSDALRDLLQGHRAGPVAVALPDPVARVTLFDVASLPSQGDDLTRLVRWHLEKTFSVELPSAQFVHQPFRRSDGEVGHRVLASAIDRAILTQYEEALLRAGLEPRVVDLASLHRFNLHRRSIMRLAEPDYHFIVLTIAAAGLTMMIVEGGTPAYLRIKGTRRALSGPGAVDRILDEVELSLNAYGKEKDLSRVTHLFVSATDAAAELSDRLAARFHLTVAILGSAELPLDGVAALSETDVVRVSAALGAAVER